MEVDALLVPAEVVAHEVYAQLATPLLWRFLREMPARGDDWADSVIGRLTDLCGTRLQSLWKVRLNAAEAPALQRRGSPGSRCGWATCCAVPTTATTACTRSSCSWPATATCHLAPPDDFRWTAGDELLLVGEPAARRLLDSTLLVDAVREYVLHGRHVPSSWIWRLVTRRSA